MDCSRDRTVLAGAQLDGGLVGAVAGPAVALGPVGDGLDGAVERQPGVQVAFPLEEHRVALLAAAAVIHLGGAGAYSRQARWAVLALREVPGHREGAGKHGTGRVGRRRGHGEAEQQQQHPQNGNGARSFGGWSSTGGPWAGGASAVELRCNLALAEPTSWHFLPAWSFVDVHKRLLSSQNPKGKRLAAWQAACCW